MHQDVFDFIISRRAVLLDMDGTLIDSNEAHARTWEKVLTEAGFSVEYSEIRSQIGKGSDRFIPNLIDQSSDSKIYENLSRERKKLFLDQFVPSLLPFNGAVAMVDLFKKLGLKVAIATAASKDELDAILGRIPIKPFIDLAITSSEIECSKPDPDVVQKCLEKLDLSPSEAVMIGDTPYDLVCAAKAGVKSIAFRTGKWPDEELKKAHFILDGPSHVVDIIKRYKK